MSGLNFIKIFDNLYVRMNKAKGFKYYKRVPKKSGKGYNYFYTKEQYDKGKKEEKPKEKKGKEKTGFAAAWSALSDFLGITNDNKLRKKIGDMYSANEDKLSGLDVSSFAQYANEYLSNKDKWDKKFAGKPIYTKDKKTGKVTKKVAGGKKPSAPGGQKWDTSLMKKVAGVIGAEMTTPKKEDIDRYKKEYKNLSKDELDKKLKDAKQYNEIEKIAAIEEISKENFETMPEGDIKYSPGKGIKMSIPEGLSKNDKELLQVANSTYGSLLSEGGRDKSFSFKDFAEEIKKTYSMDNPRNKAIYDALIRADKAGDKTPLMSPEEKLKLINKVKKISDESSELGIKWNKENKRGVAADSKELKSIMKKRRSKRDQMDKIIDKLADAGVFDEKENFSISDIGAGRLPKSLREKTDVKSKNDKTAGMSSGNVIKEGSNIFTKKDGLWSMVQEGREGEGPFPNGIRITAPETIKELDAKLKKQGDKTPIMSPGKMSEHDKYVNERLKPVEKNIEERENGTIVTLDNGEKKFIDKKTVSYLLLGIGAANSAKRSKQTNNIIKQIKKDYRVTEGKVGTNQVINKNAEKRIKDEIKNKSLKELEKMEYDNLMSSKEDPFKIEKISVYSDAVLEKRESDKTPVMSDKTKLSPMAQRAKDLEAKGPDKPKEKSQPKEKKSDTKSTAQKKYDDAQVKITQFEEWADKDEFKDDPAEWDRWLKEYEGDLKNPDIYDKDNPGDKKAIDEFKAYKKALKDVPKLKEKLMGPKLFKATQLLLQELEKAKKMPIGTISNGRKKVAEGKWVPVSEGKPKKEEPKPKKDESGKKKPDEKKKEDAPDSNRGILKNAAKKIINILAEALSGKDVNQPTGQAVEAAGEAVRPKQKPKPKKDDKSKKDDKNK